MEKGLKQQNAGCVRCILRRIFDSSAGRAGKSLGWEGAAALRYCYVLGSY
jgi:hypothetical protein